MMLFLDKIAAIIAKVLFILASMLAIAMVVLNGTSIFFRYALHSSFSWGEEVLKIMLVWFGLFSVGVIAHKRDHIGIVIVKGRMPQNVQRVFELICEIMMLIISVVMFIAGIRFVASGQNAFTPALRIPNYYVYMGIPIAFCCMSIIELRNLLYDLIQMAHRIKEFKNAGPEDTASKQEEP